MGIDELRERIFKERKFLIASATYPGGVPAVVDEQGDAPAGIGHRDHRRRRAHRFGHTRRCSSPSTPRPFQRWDTANVVRGRANGTVSAYAYCPPRRHHRRPVPRPRADPARLRTSSMRITNRQNFVLRGLTEEQLADAARPPRRARHGRRRRRARARRRVVPRRRHLQPRGHAVRGLAADIGDALGEGRPGRGAAACASTSPAARTPAASTTSPTSASSASSAAPTGAPLPATRCCSAATSATWRSRSARRRPSCRPRPRPRPSCGSSGSSPASATPARRSPTGSTASGGAGEVGRTLVDLDEFPDPRRGARLLHRLRRDRPLRRRGRRRGVRDVSSAQSLTATEDTSAADIAPGASTSGTTRRGRAPRSRRARRGLREARDSSRRSSAIKWAWEQFGPDVVLAASFQDCVLIDLAMQVVPEMEVVFLDTQYHFAETLWYVEQVRERYDLNLNVVHPADRARRPLADRPRRVLREPQGGPAGPRPRRQVGVADRAAATESRPAGQRTDRLVRHRPRHREGQPDRDLDRRRRSTTTARPRPAQAPAPRQGLRARSAAGPARSRWPKATTPAPAAGPAPASWSAASTSEPSERPRAGSALRDGGPQ